jgi:PmbA protein
MITNDKKQIAQGAMDYALKQGCEAAKVTLMANSNSSFELRNGRIDRLQQASENRLSIALYVDGRYGNFSTNRLDLHEVEAFIRGGIDATRLLAPDPCRTLADPARYYRGGMPDLQLFDNTVFTLNADDKVALAQAVAEEAMGHDERIISVDSSYSDGESASYRLMSNGFEGESRATWFALGAAISIRGEGDARPADGWYESRLFFDVLPKTGVGTRALERTLRKLGQKKVASGKYTMVMDNITADSMLSPLLEALQGAALQQHNSFLLDKLGQQLANPLLTVTDEPHTIGATGARYFDGEGVATMPRPIIEAGILRTYFIDTYNGRKMDVAPTISAPSRVVMQPGDRSVDELVKDIDRGILVTALNGGNSNSSTGDFSYGIEGFLIENGQLTRPVSEMNITGNFLTLWPSLAAVGNDPRPGSSWAVPSLVFNAVSFSGL